MAELDEMHFHFYFYCSAYSFPSYFSLHFPSLLPPQQSTLPSALLMHSPHHFLLSVSSTPHHSLTRPSPLLSQARTRAMVYPREKRQHARQLRSADLCAWLGRRPQPDLHFGGTAGGAGGGARGFPSCFRPHLHRQWVRSIPPGFISLSVCFSLYITISVVYLCKCV